MDKQAVSIWHTNRFPLPNSVSDECSNTYLLVLGRVSNSSYNNKLVVDNNLHIDSNSLKDQLTPIRAELPTKLYIHGIC